MRANYQDRLGLSYAPSTFQAKIFDWIETGRGHAVVEAVAGSGKTTTIVSAAKLIRGSGLFVAFNKSIADLLASKLAGTSMSSSTVHSHGFAAIRSGGRRVKVDGKKYLYDIDAAEAAIERRGAVCGLELSTEQLAAIREDGFPSHTISKLVNLARLNLVDMDADDFADELLALAAHHELFDFDECLDTVVAAIVQNCMWRGADDLSVIDYTDMVWLPTVCRIRPRQYDWMFVDECQDISRAHLALLRASVRRGGRMLFVGDRRQAIYGFAGADAESFANIQTETDAAVMPLSICYRCPTAVLALARAYCPQIQARDGAPEGVVRSTKRSEYVAEAREGDLVLCRRNAPLLGLCFELIAAGVPAVVRGRDIAVGLCKIVDKIGKRHSIETFGEGITAWLEGQSRAAARRITDEDRLADRVALLTDQAEALRVIWSKSSATTLAGLRSAIEDLFSDERGSVMLSSVHKAKGLEAERVVILDSDALMSSRAKQPWQVEQERNLAYVAYTRAMSELIEIPSDSTSRGGYPTHGSVTRSDPTGAAMFQRAAGSVIGTSLMAPAGVSWADVYSAERPID